MIDAIILAGGLGTRLAPILPHLPKTLAPIQKTPFLQLLINQLARSGIVSKIVMALSHKASAIESFIQSHSYSLPIEFSFEPSPLGTGGAILHALPKTTSDTLLILNGDSFFDLPLADFYHFHLTQKGSLTIACRYVEDCSRYGSILFDNSQKIYRFTEKSQTPTNGWINSGIYLIQRHLFSPFCAGVYSLESEFFPQFLQSTAFAYLHTGAFIDIGTPSSYREAQEILQPWT
jgi:NDP-sugar pyrophosphorylase family protein